MRIGLHWRSPYFIGHGLKTSAHLAPPLHVDDAPYRATPGSSLPASTSGAAIDIRNAIKRYGPHHALNDVDLFIEPGEFLTLLGPSGSGKSTLLACIAGFEALNSGQIYVDQQVLDSITPHKRGFGMVFQNYALFPHMTVEQNVAFPLRMAGHTRRERAMAVQEALDMLRIAEHAKKKPNALSGGQQQRVAIARAIVRRPRLVLMDEPLSALDKRLRQAIQLELRDLHQQIGATIVFVTHDQHEALALSDRIAVLNEGRIVQLGTPADLYREPENEFVARFVGESNLIPVSVQARHGQHLTLQGPGPLRFETDARQARVFAWSPGESAIALLRPEHIQFSHSHSAGAIRATVRAATFLGELLRLDVVVDGGVTLQLRGVSAINHTTPAVGDIVHLSWNPRDCWLLPAT